jgi:hypothetical protein
MSYSRILIACCIILALLSAGAQAQAVKSTPGKILVNKHTSIWAIKNVDSGRTSHGVFWGYEYLDELVRALREAGHSVDVESLHHLSDALLAPYDVLLMPMPGIVLGPDDIEALRNFIRNGGGVGIMVSSNQQFLVAPPAGSNRISHKMPDIYPNLANMQLFTAPFGITFGDNSFRWVVVEVNQQSPLAGPLSVQNLNLPVGYATLIIDPAKAASAATLPFENRVMVSYVTDKSLLGKGRLVVCSNSFGFFDEFIRTKDNLGFVRNLVEYLLSEDAIPDYAIINHAVTAKKPFPGDDITVSANVKNISTASAPATTLSITLYAYDEATKSAGTLVKKLKSVAIGSLAAGAQFVYTSDLRIPGSVEPGAYVVVFRVDPNGATADTNIANNTRISRKFVVR